MQGVEVKNQQITQPEKLKALFFRLSLIALVALGGIVFMGKSYQQSLQAMDSSLHARLARFK